MWTIDISWTMKMWADSNPEKSRLISTLMSSYDHQRGVYCVLMEAKDLRGNKIKSVRTVDNNTLIGAKDLQRYMFALFNGMFDELYKEKEKEMEIEFARREDNDVRLKMAKAAVVKWYNEHNQSRPIGIEDVYIVWFSKVLQNWKALAGTHHNDGMYYEITFDGNNDLVYFDAYKKWQNVQMDGSTLREGISK